LSAKNDMELLHADRTVVEGEFANLRHREALLATRESTLEKYINTLGLSPGTGLKIFCSHPPGG
jgi:hypothetical protein